jgi:hypothetical protein
MLTMEALETQNGPWRALDQRSPILITLMRTRIWDWIRTEVKSWIRNRIKVKSWIRIRISDAKPHSCLKYRAFYAAEQSS